MVPQSRKAVKTSRQKEAHGSVLAVNIDALHLRIIRFKVSSGFQCFGKLFCIATLGRF